MKLPIDSRYWSNRYLNNELSWDIGAVSPPLQAYFDQLTNKDLFILIPGAGNAYEAETLVNKGFTNVFVCDLAPEPLQNLKKRCPAVKDQNLLLADFFDLGIQRQTGPEQDQTQQNESQTERTRSHFDLIIEQTFFCALDPSLRKKYFEKMADLLTPEGKLVGLLFDAELNTDKPPFSGSKEEYLTYIGNDFNIKTFEACYNSIKPRMNRELFINLVRNHSDTQLTKRH